jgi:Tfp pilus assembly protein PilF
VARQYVEHREFARAKPLFERFLAMNDFDEKEAAEIGAYYLLNGDRATAEAWFDRSVKKDPQNVWATMRMAGAYLGVSPQD